MPDPTVAARMYEPTEALLGVLEGFPPIGKRVDASCNAKKMPILLSLSSICSKSVAGRLTAASS